jgi:predicted amidohydrolase YtcJ
MAAFPGGTPLRETLDVIVPDRPVYLTNRDGHGAWVNSRALEMAGISSGTPDPSDGRIERDATGEPAGTLQEGAMDLVERLVPEPTPAEWEESILLAQSYLHGLGITAWQDAIVTPQTLTAYRRLAERGALTARVVGALWWDRHRGEEQIGELVDLRLEGSVGRLACTSVKVMQDGVCENFTASLLEPYLDETGRATDNRGISMVDPALLNRVVARLDREGFQVHVHAIGDRAVREALDAFEAAVRSNGVGDRRHHIAHLQLVHPADVPRFGAMGVVANAQPFWACMDDYQRELTIPFLGSERSSRQYPFGSLRRQGARLAFGSDWDVSTPDPLIQMEVAVNRTAPDDRGAEPLVPEERIDLAAALEAFTAGSAFVNHLDDLTGSIEPGKLADLAVLDRDIFAPDAGPIGDTRVVLTLVEGEPVHAEPGIW